MGTENATEAEFRVFASYPILSTSVLPCLLGYFDLDIYVFGKLVDNIANGYVQFALRIGNVRLPLWRWWRLGPQGRPGWV
jgi:hypothetical protein